MDFKDRENDGSGLYASGVDTGYEVFDPESKPVVRFDEELLKLFRLKKLALYSGLNLSIEPEQ